MDKIFLDYNQQIEMLKSNKKLNISNPGYAKEMLKRYSYYSLIDGYKKEFKDASGSLYRTDVCFEDIVALYEFDENLRALFLKYLLKVERQIKSHLSYYFCDKYGEAQTEYLKESNYNYINKNKNDVDKLVGILCLYARGHKDHTYIRHAISAHGNLPLWVLMNALTFGNVSKFYYLSQYDIQAKIAINYDGINESQLAKLLIVLTGFRNVCAHGERLYCYQTKQAIPDLPLHQKLGIAISGQEYVCGKRDLFAVVIAMRYLLPNDWFIAFKKELIKAISNYLGSTSCFSEKNVLEFMGFPMNWKNITKYGKNYNRVSKKKSL